MIRTTSEVTAPRLRAKRRIKTTWMWTTFLVFNDGFQRLIVFGKKAKSGSKKKSKRRGRSRSPPAVPVVFAAEEIPEDATTSASDDEKEKAESSMRTTGISRYPSSSSASKGTLD